MTVKPRTIDNLGVDASIRYAKDQELFEARFIEEARLIPQKTTISVAKPYALSEFDQIYSVGKTVAWAVFAPPPNFFLYDKGLFSYQLIPSLGDYEKLETDEDKIEAMEGALQKLHKKSKKNHADQDDQEREKDEKERKILLHLFHCIDKLNKVLTMVNARRNQYQRG